MQSTSFTTTTVVSEETLQSRMKTLVYSGRIVQMSLLGAITSAKVGYPQLLFAVTRNRKNAKIKNLIQMGASILSTSKFIFLGALSTMLSLLDWRKAELAYCGKSSSSTNLAG
jgi:hypothetical protein